MWKARAHAVIEMQGDNLGNTHTINVANASAMELEKGNDWYSRSVEKLKHTAAAAKPCMNLVTVSKGYVTRVHSTNVQDEGLRIGGIGHWMTSKVKISQTRRVSRINVVVNLAVISQHVGQLRGRIEGFCA
jgi:hypothetical protein